MERRKTRSVKPVLESLEGKLLLSAVPPTISDGEKAAHDLETPFPKFNRFSYALPGGGRVFISLYGPGSLRGTRVENGVLHLSFNGTTQRSGIVGRVQGVRGRAPVGSIIPYALRNTPDSVIGGGAPEIAYINLHRFKLINGGRINLLGGIGAMYLGEAGPNTQIYMKQGPISPILNSITRPLVFRDTPTGLEIIPPTTVGVTAPSGSTIAGELLVPSDAAASQAVSRETPLEELYGIDFQIDKINARPAPNEGPRLQFPQMFAVDVDGGGNTDLIRYQVNLADNVARETLRLPLGNLVHTPEVGLGRLDNDRLVVLVGAGTTVRVYDALDPTMALGSFTTTNLSGIGSAPITGVGSSPVTTVLSFDTPMDMDTMTSGAAWQIDLSASLASGQAVPIGSVFRPERGFNLLAGATGAAGSDALVLLGDAHFDSFTPNKIQAGFLGVRASETRLTEGGRAQIRSPSGSEITKSVLDTDPDPFPNTGALGSVEQNLALVTSFANGINTVSFYNTASTTGGFLENVAFTNDSRITGLSESYHPELVGASVIDVQGNLRTFRAGDVQGMVLNVNNFLIKTTIHRASDSTIVGRPVAHVDIGTRSNVEIFSTPRPVEDRGGVRIFEASVLRPFGPLMIPTGRRLLPTRR
jgi:hypothetical protein